MSIIRNIELTLESVISSSNLIVEAKVVGPYEEYIPLVNDINGKRLPDFIKSGLIFQVTRILKNTSTDAIPDTIRVPNENWRRSFSQHKEQYLNGPSKSFTVSIYNSEVPSMNDANILFLNRQGEDFNLTAKKSYESLDSLEMIKRIIGTPAASGE